MAFTGVLQSYENVRSITGNSQSVATYRSPTASWAADRILLLGATDSQDDSLKCTSVRARRVFEHEDTPYMLLIATFTPKEKVEEQDPDEPLRWRLEFTSESFTIFKIQGDV